MARNVVKNAVLYQNMTQNADFNKLMFNKLKVPLFSVQEAVESEHVTTSGSWLQECCISLSPSNDTLAVAKNDKAIFLTSKQLQKANNGEMRYEININNNQPNVHYCKCPS